MSDLTKRANLTRIAGLYNDHSGLRNAVRAIADSTEAGVGWKKHAQSFLGFLDTGNPAFTIIAEGNKKLPFLTFSALPLVTCPGMGECKDFCYSLKAWRYPAAFFRQLQNTILLHTNRGAIKRALKSKLAERKFINQDRVAFRLYVDGDIENLVILEFWFNTLRSIPTLDAYGYSKSFGVFQEYQEKHGADRYPTNYTLNLSSGSRYDDNGGMQAFMNSLPVTRGTFTSVKLESKPVSRKEYVKDTRAAFGNKKAFVCPGQCGECIKVKGINSHACGSQRMKGIPIVIAAH